MKLEIVNSFLDMKTNLLFFISLTMVILVGCNKPRSVEQQILSIENPKLNPSKRVVVDTIPLFVEDEEPSGPELKQTVSVDGVDHLVTIHLIRLPFVFEEDVAHTKQMLIDSIRRILS